MKKFLRKVVTAVIAIVMMSITSIAIFAESSVSLFETVEFDGVEMYLISEEVTIEEDCTVTNRLYSTVNPKTKGAVGSGRFRNEKEEEYINLTLKYWVQGDFEWNEDNDTVVAYNATFGHTYPSELTFSNTNIDYASNQEGFLFGKKYAYVDFSFSATNPVGMVKNLNAYIDVNVLGKVTYR